MRDRDPSYGFLLLMVLCWIFFIICLGMFLPHR